MAVNLLAPLGTRYRPEALPAAVATGEHLGYKLLRADAPDDQLCAWIDWAFAPSWWSSEARGGPVWYALAGDGTIAGFAAFGSTDYTYHWLQPYRKRADVGIFGPYGVASAHRKTGLGEVLLVAALCDLAERFRWALIPAVSGERLIASYEERADAHVVDSYDYALRSARAVILASGEGSNAQAVIDEVQSGDSSLDIVGVVANRANARVLVRASGAGIPKAAVVWERASEARDAYDARLIETVAGFEPDLILLLGWMHSAAAGLSRTVPRDDQHPSGVLALRPPRRHGRNARRFHDPRVSRRPRTGSNDRGRRAVGRCERPSRYTGNRSRRNSRAHSAALGAGATLDQFHQQIHPLEHAAVSKAIRRWCLTS